MLTQTLFLHYIRVLNFFLNFFFCFCKIANFTIVAQTKQLPVLLSTFMATAGHCHTAFCLFYQSISQNKSLCKSCLLNNIKNIFKLLCLWGDSRYNSVQQLLPVPVPVSEVYCAAQKQPITESSRVVVGRMNSLNWKKKQNISLNSKHNNWKRNSILTESVF